MCAALSENLSTVISHLDGRLKIRKSPVSHHCWECKLDFAEEDTLRKHIISHVRQPCIVLQRVPATEPPIKITLKTRNNNFEIVHTTDPVQNGETQAKRKRGRKKAAANKVEDNHQTTDDTSQTSLGTSEGSATTGGEDSQEATAVLAETENSQDCAEISQQATAEICGEAVPLSEAAACAASEEAEELIEEIANPEQAPKLRFVQPQYLLKPKEGKTCNKAQHLGSDMVELKSPLADNQQSPDFAHKSPSQPDHERSLWNTPTLDNTSRLPEPDKDVGNLLQTLFNNNESQSSITNIPNNETEYISLERLGERNKQLQVYNSNNAAGSALVDSIGLPMQQLAQQVSRLQSGLHQQNVLINIQQFPQAPPQPPPPQQQPPPPPYCPPPPMHHYPGPPMQNPGMYHQPYHMPPPNPMYYPPQGYPQLPQQPPPPYRQQMPPPQMQQPRMPMQHPSQQQQQQHQQQQQQQQQHQQQQQQQPRPPMQNQQPRLMSQQPRMAQPRGGTTMQPRGPMGPRQRAPMRGPTPRQQVRMPRGPNRQHHPLQQQQQQQQQHQRPQPKRTSDPNAIVPIKRKRMDMLIPDKHDDADCQVISMQPPPNEGIPVIQNVQGAASLETDPVVHLTDSITLSVRNPNTTVAIAPQQKSDAKVVANILATRGITVTAAAKPKENTTTSGSKKKSQTPPPPAVAINLNSAVSIIPSGKPKAAPSSSMATITKTTTVDLTDDSDPALPPQQQTKVHHHHQQQHQQQQPQRGLPFRCDLCPAQYPTSVGLSKHRQSYHKAAPPAEIGIPLIDLSKPSVLAKLASLGIFNYIPLPGATADARLGLPVVSVNSTGSPSVCNIAGLGATSILTLGPVRSIPKFVPKGLKLSTYSNQHDKCLSKNTKLQ